MVSQLKLSKTELKLIQLLEDDARKPYSHYAKKLKVSPDSVVRMISNFRKKGLLEGFYTVINLPKISYMYSRVFVKYTKIDQKTEDAIVAALVKNPKVGWVAIGEGGWDLIVVFIVRSVDELSEETRKFFSKYSSLIKDKEISIQTQLYCFTHKYLFETPDYFGLKYEDIGNKVQLSDLDFGILHRLADDARVSVSDIASQLGVSFNTVKYRIKRLISRKVILGFRPKLNTALLGFEHFKLFLRLEKLDEGSIKKLISFLSADLHVLYITQAIGRSDLEFEIEFENRRVLNEFMRLLKNKFFDIIMDYSVVQHYAEPYINFLPGELG